MSGLFTGSISMHGKQFLKGSHAFLFGILACPHATELEIQFHLQLELRIPYYESQNMSVTQV